MTITLNLIVTDEEFYEELVAPENLVNTLVATAITLYSIYHN